MHNPATLCTVRHFPVAPVIHDAVVRDLAAFFKSLEIFGKVSSMFLSIPAVFYAGFAKSKQIHLPAFKLRKQIF